NPIRINLFISLHLSISPITFPPYFPLSFSYLVSPLLELFWFSIHSFLRKTGLYYGLTLITK
ncbi:MAG: hypothetical protein DRP38_04175, partial [Thermotogae bacterium]